MASHGVPLGRHARYPSPSRAYHITVHIIAHLVDYWVSRQHYPTISSPPVSGATLSYIIGASAAMMLTGCYITLHYWRRRRDEAHKVLHYLTLLAPAPR